MYFLENTTYLCVQNLFPGLSCPCDGLTPVSHQLHFCLIAGLDTSQPGSQDGGSFLIDGLNIIRTLHYELCVGILAFIFTMDYDNSPSCQKHILHESRPCLNA